MKNLDLYTELMFTNANLSWGGGEGKLTTFCVRNCIKCPEIYRKVMFANLPPNGVGSLSN